MYLVLLYVYDFSADHLVSDNLTEESDLEKTNSPSPRSC